MSNDAKPYESEDFDGPTPDRFLKDVHGVDHRRVWATVARVAELEAKLAGEAARALALPYDVMAKAVTDSENARREAEASAAAMREALIAVQQMLENSRRAKSKGSAEYDGLFLRCELGPILEVALSSDAGRAMLERMEKARGLLQAARDAVGNGPQVRVPLDEALALLE
jgi:hypothetical protein